MDGNLVGWVCWQGSPANLWACAEPQPNLTGWTKIRAWRKREGMFKLTL